MKSIEIISGLLILVFGVLVLVVIIPIWVPTILDGNYGLRAKDMPTVAAITVITLAAIFLVGRLRIPGSSADDSPITRENWLFVLRASVFLIILVALFQWIGFLIAGPITIAGFMLIMGERRFVPMVATAIGASAGIWLFFWQLLKFPLP